MRPSAECFKKIVGDKPVKVLECGVWTGDNATVLYENFNCEWLYLMDKWYEYYEHYHFPGMHQYAVKVFEKFDNKPNVIIIRADTLTFPLFPKAYFDYIYLDDNHSYEHVIQEITKYDAILKPGGVIGGDNYEIAGVKKAVDQYYGEKRISTAPWKKASNGNDVLDWWIYKEK